MMMYSTGVSSVQFHVIIQESLFYQEQGTESECQAIQSDLMGKLFYEVAILQHEKIRMQESVPLNITSRNYKSSYKLDNNFPKM